MRKKHLHAQKEGLGDDLYLGSLEAYKNAFMTEHASGQSWWKLVANKPYKIYPNMARLIAKGYDPGNRIRREMRLPDKQAVQVCKECGEVHIKKHPRKYKKRNRIAIRLDNPESAVRSIKGHMEQGKIDQLIELLK